MLNASLSYGIDWSDRVQPTSHCWFLHTDRGTCSYDSCSVPASTKNSSFIKCGSCALVIHSEHLADFDHSDYSHNRIAPCRPSFSDDSPAENPEKFDQHFWSPISSLKRPCIQCNRKIISNSLYRNGERYSKRAIDHRDRNNSVLGKIQRKQGFACLWCERVCHRLCWESMNNDEDDWNRCDYGRYKNIIVRPQWLRRMAGPPKSFHASFSHDSNANHSSFTPLLLFINTLSGGQQGEKIYRKLIRSLNPRQVFLLRNNADLEQALDTYASLENSRICVCGGDGTVGWLISTLAEKYPSLSNPPISICPLGTGNDLSRVLGWGWHYKEKILSRTLLEVSNARSIALDRWQISLGPLLNPVVETEPRNDRRCFSCLLEHPRFVLERDPPLYQQYRTALNLCFSNYLSFGLDAAVVLDFHAQRMQNPSGFTSPFKNKLLYLNASRRYFKEFALWRSWDLGPYMRIICDEQDVTDSIRQCHTVLLLNISSYGSGTRPWGSVSRRSGTRSKAAVIADRQITSSRLREADETNEMVPSRISPTTTQFQEQSLNDGKIEVIGLDSIQMALIHLGLRGRRIAQCTRVRIELLRAMPVHMDGDPFYLSALSAIDVKHAGQVSVLSNRN